MFIEATLIIEGALEETHEFTEDDELQTWLFDLRQEHRDTSAESQWQVFTLTHDHESGIECECVQYLTDHKPSHIIG